MFPRLCILTGVPFLKNAPRAPLGPSVVFMEGIPFSGIATVLQKSAAASKDICTPVVQYPAGEANQNELGPERSRKPKAFTEGRDTVKRGAVPVPPVSRLTRVGEHSHRASPSR
jgi:hypothetical protein